MSDSATIDLGWSPLPSRKHEAWFSAPPRPDRRTLALLGGWSSGKSVAAIRRHLVESLKRGYVEAYRDGNPCSVIMAPAAPILRTSTLPTFREICPRELIMRERKTPPISIQLVNGHVIYFLSAAANVEGLNLTHATLDEIQHVQYTAYPTRYANMQNRLRDVKATHPFLFLACGLPLFGRVREWFLRPSALCIRVGAGDNKYLSPDTIRGLRDGCSKDEVGVKVDGEWGSPPDRSFRSYDARVHVIDEYGRPDAETWGGFDFGKQSCFLIGQPRGEGLVVVDEILTRDATTRDICRKVKERGWNPRVIAVDPSSSVNLDTMNVLAEAFPNAILIKRYTSDPFFAQEYGWTWLSRCIMDGEGEIRIWFSRALEANPRGLLNGLANARSNEATGLLVRTKDAGAYSDHPLDACRYLASLISDRTEGRI